jgi:HEAT repeat protein
MRCKSIAVPLACLILAALSSTTSADENGQQILKDEVKPRTFRGEPIDQWVERLRKGPVEELNKAGKEALPVWVAAVADPKARTWVRHALSWEFQDEDWVGPVYVAWLDVPGPLNRNMAIFELGRRPNIAKQTGPALIERARQWAKSDKNEDFRHVDSLIEILNSLESPTDGTIELVADIWPNVSDDTFLKRDLLKLLAQNGSKSVDVAFEIFLTHQTPLDEIGYYAGHADKRTMIRIIDESTRQSPERRRLASALIAHVAKLGEPDVDSAALVRGINRLIDDSDLHVRRYALEGARNLNGTAAAETLIPKLEGALSDPDSTSRYYAASALAAFGPKAMPSIRRAVKSEDAETRIVAGAAIREMSPLPDEGIDLLLQLAKDENPKVRNYAVYNLGETQVDDRRVIDTLVRAIDDRATEKWAMRALAEIGKNEDKVVEVLKPKLESSDIQERLDAATALWTITQNAEMVLPVARAIARDDQGITLSIGMMALRTVDGKQVEQRSSRQFPLAARAALLLGKMGVEAEPAVDELIGLLNHENLHARRAAIYAIGEIGPAASKAIPDLEKLLAENASRQTRSALEKVRAKTPVAGEDGARQRPAKK